MSARPSAPKARRTLLRTPAFWVLLAVFWIATALIPFLDTGCMGTWPFFFFYFFVPYEPVVAILFILIHLAVVFGLTLLVLRAFGLWRPAPRPSAEPSPRRDRSNGSFVSRPSPTARSAPSRSPDHA